MSRDKKNNKAYTVNVRLTDKEYKKLNKETEKSNLTKSEYIRKTLFAKPDKISNKPVDIDYKKKSVYQEILNLLRDYKDGKEISDIRLIHLEDKLWEI